MYRANLTLLLMCFLISPVKAQFASERSNDQGKPQANEAAEVILRDLREARELLKRMPASGNRDRIELLLTRTELQLKQLGMALGAPAAKPKPMSPEDFNRFSISMRNQAFDKDKYQFLETAMAGRYFTCDQASQLMKHFSFDIDRIKAAVAIYPQLTDQGNFHRVLEVFTFETNRKTVMERIKMR